MNQNEELALLKARIYNPIAAKRARMMAARKRRFLKHYPINMQASQEWLQNHPVFSKLHLVKDWGNDGE